jgi:hypothetical protein
LLSRGWFLARDISGKLVLIEHLPDCREETRQLLGVLWATLGFIRKRDQFLADEVVECDLCAESPLDCFRRPTRWTQIFSKRIRG